MIEWCLQNTDVLKDKDTVKLVKTEASVIRTLTFINEASSSPVSADGSIQEDSSSCSSFDTILLLQPSQHQSEPRTTNFVIPTFSYNVDMLLQDENKAYESDSHSFRIQA